MVLGEVGEKGPWWCAASEGFPHLAPLRCQLTALEAAAKRQGMVEAGMVEADEVPEARFTSMRQQHAWDLQRLPNIHRSTFAQEAAPPNNALTEPHPKLPWDGPSGYNSRFLPAITPAWRSVEKKTDFAGHRPKVEMMIRKKHERDVAAAQRAHDSRTDERMRYIERKQHDAMHPDEARKRVEDMAKDKELFLKNRKRKLLVMELMQEMADKEAKRGLKK